jgi:hypothetical protein
MGSLRLGVTGLIWFCELGLQVMVVRLRLSGGVEWQRDTDFVWVIVSEKAELQLW